MAGLVPAIHAFKPDRRGRRRVEQRELNQYWFSAATREKRTVFLGIGACTRVAILIEYESGCE
jgi:hypothetical protein